MAAERLASIEVGEFVDRMEREQYFHDVVLDVAEFVCAVNPYDQSQNPGCGFIREIVALQSKSPAQSNGDDLEKSRAVELGSEPVELKSTDETWMETLARLSGR
jgi:hypothetical protein